MDENNGMANAIPAIPLLPPLYRKCIFKAGQLLYNCTIQLQVGTHTAMHNRLATMILFSALNKLPEPTCIATHNSGVSRICLGGGGGGGAVQV